MTVVASEGTFAPRRPTSFVRRWLAASGLCFLVLAVWAIAIPPYAAPDEPDHIIKAAGIAYGDFLGEPVPERHEAARQVLVPSNLSTTNRQYCYYHRSNRSAECAVFEEHDDRRAELISIVGSYPPAYYMAIAPVLRIDTGIRGLRASRMVSALGASVLLGLAAAVTLSRRRPGVRTVGLLAAVTPMVLFLGSTVNPSGVETAAGVALWCCAIAVFEDGPTKRGIWLLAVPLLVMTLLRPLSPAWAVCALVAAAPLLSADRARALVSSSVARIAVAAFVALAAVTAAWVATSGSLGLQPGPRPEDTRLGALLGDAFSMLGTWARDLVGNFGWQDAPVPTVALRSWIVAIVVLVVLALVVGSVRHRIALALAVAGSVFAPVVLSVPKADEVGFVWQGRYLLPFAVGVPLLAASAIADSGRRVPRWTLGIFAVVLWLAHVLSFSQLLVRHGVGLPGDATDLFDARWSPPIHAVALLVVEAVLLAGVHAWVVTRPVDPVPSPASTARETGHRVATSSATD